MQTAYFTLEVEYAAVVYWFMNLSLYKIFISWYRLLLFSTLLLLFEWD